MSLASKEHLGHRSLWAIVSGSDRALMCLSAGDYAPAMPAPKPRIAATDALVGLWTVALTAFVIAALYFGRDLLIPLALAALLTFLLSPLVTRLERWLGLIVAVLLVVALIF